MPALPKVKAKRGSSRCTALVDCCRLLALYCSMIYDLALRYCDGLLHDIFAKKDMSDG
jgi:hypothetical protein